MIIDVTQSKIEKRINLADISRYYSMLMQLHDQGRITTKTLLNER